MPQQPNATMTGQIRLCGPRTAGDRNGRLLAFVLPFVVVFTLLFVIVGAFLVPLLAAPLLRFLLLGIAFLHSPFCLGDSIVVVAPTTTSSLSLSHHVPEYSSPQRRNSPGPLPPPSPHHAPQKSVQR
jgi:hypothetical protein